MASRHPAPLLVAATDVFVEYEEGRRNRRTLDAVLLAVTALVSAAAAALANAVPVQDAEVGDAIVTLLGWAGALWRVVVLATILLGAVLLAAAKIPWLGKLPGDITYQGKGFTFYFPLATSLAVSVILSLVFWLLSKKR